MSIGPSASTRTWAGAWTPISPSATSSGGAIYADGSQASIQFGTGISQARPGSTERMYLVVQDINAARADLVARGVDVSEVFHTQSVLQAGIAGRVPGPAPERRSYGSFASFSDPDGNGYVLQEITQRLPGRE